eukprot:SAG31_NODE_417_length_15907_cov_6.901759_6_plen_92_part_00
MAARSAPRAAARGRRGRIYTQFIKFTSVDLNYGSGIDRRDGSAAVSAQGWKEQLQHVLRSSHNTRGWHVTSPVLADPNASSAVACRDGCEY